MKRANLYGRMDGQTLTTEKFNKYPLCLNSLLLLKNNKTDLSYICLLL